MLISVGINFTNNYNSEHPIVTAHSQLIWNEALHGKSFLVENYSRFKTFPILQAQLSSPNFRLDESKLPGALFFCIIVHNYASERLTQF